MPLIDLRGGHDVEAKEYPYSGKSRNSNDTGSKRLGISELDDVRLYTVTAEELQRLIKTAGS